MGYSNCVVVIGLAYDNWRLYDDCVIDDRIIHSVKILIYKTCG